MPLSEVLALVGETKKAESMFKRAVEHFHLSTNMSLPEAQTVDFDKLVPYLDR